MHEAADGRSPAVMCLDGDGAVVFMTMRARELCQRWNQALPSSGQRLPLDVGKQFTPPQSRLLLHPTEPGLAATVDSGLVCSGIGSRPGFVITFTESAFEMRLRRLTPRERRVALLVVEGLRNEQIAQRLSRSRRTVEFQLNSIFRKLEISSRAQLMRALL